MELSDEQRRALADILIKSWVAYVIQKKGVEPVGELPKSMFDLMKTNLLAGATGSGGEHIFPTDLSPTQAVRYP